MPSHQMMLPSWTAWRRWASAASPEHKPHRASLASLDSVSKEINQAALGKFAEAVNSGNFDIFDQVVAPDCVDHDPAAGQVVGPAGYRMFFSGMRAAFPDMAVAVETMVANADTIAFAYTLT